MCQTLSRKEFSVICSSNIRNKGLEWATFPREVFTFWALQCYRVIQGPSLYGFSGEMLLLQMRLPKVSGNLWTLGSQLMMQTSIICHATPTSPFNFVFLKHRIICIFLLPLLTQILALDAVSVSNTILSYQDQ